MGKPYIAVKNWLSNLQIILGMLRYRLDSTKMLEYVNSNKSFLGKVDLETAYAMGAMLKSDKIIKFNHNDETEGCNMCKALDDLYNDGVAKGETIGLTKGEAIGKTENSRETILDFLSEHGEITNEITEKLNAENDLNVLKKWIKLSARVSSIEEFVGLID